MTQRICRTHNQHSNVCSERKEGQDQNFLNRLTALLMQFPQIKLALLFGSQASGNVHPDSDIDLGILAQEPLSVDFKLQLIETIGTQLGRPVDIVDLSPVPEPITGQILKGVRLIGNDTTCGNLLYRHLLNAADFLPLQQRILTERRNRWIKCYHREAGAAAALRPAHRG